MRLLDLFCGAGGAAKGYEQAGFTHIVGVDIERIQNYPYEFVRYDALDYMMDHDVSDFDLIHASPPCQAYGWTASQWTNNYYPRYIERIRDILVSLDCYYVIENVPKAPLNNPVILCGQMFDLPIVRKRAFETNWPIEAPDYVRTRQQVKKGELITVVGHGCSGSNDFREWCLVMDIYWMTKKQLAQAIPPAYTKYIGREFISHVTMMPN